MPWSMNRSAPGRPISRAMAKQWTVRVVTWISRTVAPPIGWPASSSEKKPPAGSRLSASKKSNRPLAWSISQRR